MIKKVSKKYLIIGVILVIVTIIFFIYSIENSHAFNRALFEGPLNNSVFKNCKYEGNFDLKGELALFYTCSENSYELDFAPHLNGKIANCCRNYPYNSKLENYKGYSMCIQLDNIITINDLNYFLHIDPRDKPSNEYQWTDLKDLAVDISKSLNISDIGFNIKDDCEVPGV